jgi:hypothetical protein
MALWGVSDATESKPKWLTTEQKEDIAANEFGWVATPGGKFAGNGNASASPEILCFVKGLSSKLGLGDIVGFDWNITTFDKSAGGTVSVGVIFNEAVTVTGTPQLLVTNDTSARNLTLDYSAGSGTTELTFIEPIAADASATDADDVLSIVANAVSLNSGTIKDTKADSVTNPQAVTSTPSTGFTTFPTVTLNNLNRSFATTAAVGAVTAKVHTVAVAAGGASHSVNDVVTIANGFGTGTNATYTVTAVTGGAVTALTLTNAGAYTAIAAGVAAIAQQSTTGSGTGLTVNLTLKVTSVVVGTAGTNYSDAPELVFAGTGVQANHTCAMTARASTITQAASIGAAAGTITVVA